MFSANEKVGTNASNDSVGCARFECHLEGDKFLLTELSRSVWENLNRSRKYRPNAVRSVNRVRRRTYPAEEKRVGMNVTKYETERRGP